VFQIGVKLAILILNNLHTTKLQTNYFIIIIWTFMDQFITCY